MSGWLKVQRARVALRKKGGVTHTPPKDDRPTLAEAGIDKNLAKEGRKLGALSNNSDLKS
ncbi:hypothetical protein M728_001068 [Ensifer sp. WSM1721]